MRRGFKTDQNRLKSGVGLEMRYAPSYTESKNGMTRLIQQRPWQELGNALRQLRQLRDLGQKEIVDLSGEAIGDRMLRAYERGEKRPSRARLLKVLIGSFEVNALTDINRVLQFASYAILSKSEIVKYGFDLPPRTNHGSVGPPADFRIEVSTLIIVDGRGREIWCHEFPSRLSLPSYQERNLVRRCTFEDLDGDGGVETLFVHVPLDFGSEGQTLICFSADGVIKWEFTPGRAVIKDTTPREYVPPYFISNVAIVPMPSASPRILVSSNHYLHNPNQIAILDIDGALVSEYWHSGHLLSVAHADLDGDGVDEVLLGGVNNGYRQATLVIFDSRNINGASSQPGRQILGFDPGTEKAVVLFPRTCVSTDASYNRVAELRVTRQQRIMLAIAEGVSEANNPGGMIYELDFDLNVVNARPDSHLQESHRALERQGLLDHLWTEEENLRLRSQVIVERRP